jgi:hypothetical protein
LRHITEVGIKERGLTFDTNTCLNTDVAVD